jgi:hypothetical protein
MGIRLEIFRDDPQGLVWIESVAGLMQATARLRTLNELNPARYFVYDVHEARVVADGSPKLDRGANKTSGHPDSPGS